MRKTFPTLAAARTWRAEAQTAVRRGAMRAPAATTVRDAADEIIEGMRSGRVRTRSGDRYKPSAIRSYEAALRDRILPILGGLRIGDVQRRDVQRLADNLLAEGRDPSTIRNALMPLRVIYRRALEDGDARSIRAHTCACQRSEADVSGSLRPRRHSSFSPPCRSATARSGRQPSSPAFAAAS